jgi:hypothetical protein
MVGLPQETKDAYFSNALRQLRERSDEFVRVYARYLSGPEFGLLMSTSNTQSELATI